MAPHETFAVSSLLSYELMHCISYRSDLTMQRFLQNDIDVSLGAVYTHTHVWHNKWIHYFIKQIIFRHNFRRVEWWNQSLFSQIHNKLVNLLYIQAKTSHFLWVSSLNCTIIDAYNWCWKTWFRPNHLCLLPFQPEWPWEVFIYCVINFHQILDPPSV